MKKLRMIIILFDSLLLGLIGIVFLLESIQDKTTMVTYLVIALLFVNTIYFMQGNYHSFKDKNQGLQTNQNQVICQTCGFKNKRGKAYCVNCNSTILVRVCPVCKEVNEHSDQYCKSCDSILQNKGKH